MQLLSEERVTELDPVFGPMGIDAGREIWGMPGLTMREKTVLLVAADVCVPEFGLPFELHIGMGLNRGGMSVEDFREILRHIAPDAGFNIVAMAFQRLIEIAGKLGHDTGTSATAGQAAAEHGLELSALRQLQELDLSFSEQVDRQAKLLWERPGLSRRERCFATFAVLVIGGTLGVPFESHVARCFASKLEATDLQAAIRILAEFSVPKAWEALIALRQIGDPSPRPQGE